MSEIDEGVVTEETPVEAAVPSQDDAPVKETEGDAGSCAAG